MADNPVVSQHVRETFFDQGYLIVPGAISPEHIVNIRSDIHAVFMQAAENAGLTEKSDHLDELYLRLKSANPEMKGRAYDIVGHMVSLKLAFLGAQLEAVYKSLLGAPAVLDNTQIRIDDPSNDRLLPLHQEVNQMSLQNVTVWTPLQDVKSQDDGGLRVIPGSHKNGFLPHRKFNEPQPYFGVQEQYYDLAEERRIELKAGDALLFHPLLIHGSVPNSQKKIRWTAVARINGLNTLRYLEGEAMRYPLDRSEPEYQRYNASTFVWGSN